MPPVIVAVAAGAAAYAAGATIITAITLAAAAASLYMVATMDMPSTPGTDPINAKQTIRSPNQPCRYVFGTAMIGGVLVFAEEHTYSSGYYEMVNVCRWVHVSKGETEYKCYQEQQWKDTTSKYLHLVVAVAAHEVEDITEVYFGDELKTDWDTEYWKINIVKGDQKTIDDIPAMLRAVPSWTDTMIGKGIAFVHVALKHSTTHFPNGIPSIKCLVKGTKLDTPFFKGFGNNVAACVYHYLRYHFGASEKMINVESFTNEFAIANEPMPHEQDAVDPDNPPDVAPPIPIRYACDGSFDADESHDNVLKKMLSTCGGSLIFTNGQYYFQVAAYRGPVSSKQVITLDNLNGPLNIVPDTPLNDRINTVKGQYLDAKGFYLQNDFAPVTNQTYIDEDGGEERVYDANFEYVLNVHQAHRLANIILKDNRYGLTVQAPMNLSGFKFNAGLLVGLDEKTLGYDDLEFRVTNWKLDPKGGVILTLKQTAPEIYDDSVAVVDPKPSSPNIPDPKFCAPVERLTFDSTETDGVYDGLLWWSHPNISNVREFTVIATSSGGEIFRFNTGKDTEIRLRDMRGVEYNITVTAYNLYGAPSAPVTIATKVGDPKPLASVVFEPDNFEINIVPKVSGLLPQNTRFIFYRANTNPPDPTKTTIIGEGVTLTDVGLTPNTAYHYYIQSVNNSSASTLAGPYATKTTDNPEDIYDFIKDEIPGQFTWVVYASDAFGANISKTYDPAIHKYEGRAYNKSTKDPSINPLDYTFFRIDDFITDEEQTILDNLAQGKLPDGSANLVKPSDVLYKPGDAAEGIINNLEQGKLPDGSANLVKPSDVLYKPGDAAEGIINNLEQGKLPDGSGDLISADDVLFKPGDTVKETNIANDSISTPKLKANAITSDKIIANAITTAKIAAGAVTASEIAAGAVTASEIAAGAITTAKIAAGAITTAKIAAGAVTASEIAANAITAAKIAAGAITADKLSANSVESDKIVANAITTAKIDAGAVTATEIAANAITSDKILANAITSSKIAAGAITAEKIAVTVVAPIYNYSEFGDVRGWTLPQGSNLDQSVQLDGKAVTTMKVTSSNITKKMSADKFTIDHNSIYEVRLSIYCNQTTAGVDQRFGLVAENTGGTGVPTKLHHPVTLAYVKQGINANLWEGAVVNGWRHMIAYIVGANADINACPKSLNVSFIAKLTGDVRRVQVFNEVVGSGNIRDVHFYSPSALKLGSGLLVANEIRAGSKITSPVIDGGTINGTTINGVTINGGTINGGTSYGNKIITESGGILVMSQYNLEAFGTMDYASIIASGNQPYLSDYIFDGKTVNRDINGEAVKTQSFRTQVPSFQANNSTPTEIVDDFLLTVKPYNHADKSVTLRFAEAITKPDGKVSTNANIYIKTMFRVPKHLVKDVTLSSGGRTFKNVKYNIEIWCTDSSESNRKSVYSGNYYGDGSVYENDGRRSYARLLVNPYGDGKDYWDLVLEGEVKVYYKTGLRVNVIPRGLGDITTVFTGCEIFSHFGVTQNAQNI